MISRTFTSLKKKEYIGHHLPNGFRIADSLGGNCVDGLAKVSYRSNRRLSSRTIDWSLSMPGKLITAGKFARQGSYSVRDFGGKLDLVGSPPVTVSKKAKHDFSWTQNIE
jgi:hypothetical protein